LVRVIRALSLDVVLAEAIEVVRRGGLIVYPTDTLYGLGADPLNERAVERVYEAKRREAKPLPILVSSRDKVEEVAYVNEEALRLMDLFWPGPLTIILPKKPRLPDLVTAGAKSVGVRIPKHDLAIALIEGCGGVLTGTSANLSGRPPPKTVEEALSQLGESVDLAIDAGPAPIGMPSTVIDLSGDEPAVVREGAVSLEALEEALGRPLKRLT